MLIVNRNHAYNTNHLIEIYANSDNEIIGVFHTGSETGDYTPVIYRGNDAQEIYQTIIRSKTHGLDVIRIDNERIVE